jgi:predicted ATPase
MRLEQLKIENFRGFESLTLDFHPEVTVLVGANGSGKTTVLEAVVLVLANLLAPEDQGALYFAATDYRPGTDRSAIDVRLGLADQRIELGVELKVQRHPNGRVKQAEEFYHHGSLERYYESSASARSVPIACCYDVERHARDSTPRSRDAIYRAPRDAWNDAWNTKAGFHELFQWIREREDIENATRVDKPEAVDFQLDAVRRAIEALLPGYTRPRVLRPSNPEAFGLNKPSLTVEKAGRVLAFDQLSHGERLLVALAGDIARRLAIANPESDDPLLGEGFVLIDEIDLHLHPEWQAKVIPALRRTFPNVQLVVTTHSLIVLSYVPSECVRLLEDFRLVEPPAPTEGREPNALATEVYGIPLRPPATQAEIARISTLIDEERFEEARAGLQALNEKLGEHDTSVVRLQTALDLEDI